MLWPPKKEWKHIIYLDANDLYGYARSKFLPTSCFKWIDPKEFDFNKYTSNSSKGCILHVDLEYPNLWVTRITQWLSISTRQNRNQKKIVSQLPIKGCRSL